MTRHLTRALALALLPYSALALMPLPANAHPHVFVDTGLRLVANEAGQITGVEVTWVYDDLYSLLLLEDMQLDGDYDGKLTAEELSKLHGFDMQWVKGYVGDLYAQQPGGAALALSAPQPLSTGFDQGRITTRHLRRFSAPVDSVALRAFDPTYYTAYDLTGGVIAPEGCNVQIAKADLEAARAQEKAALAQLPPDPDDYPEIGEAFADRVQITCAR